MIKTTVIAHDQEDVTMRGYLTTNATPNSSLEFIVVEFELVVVDDSASDAIFSKLDFSDSVALSVGGASLREWEYIYRNAEGFLFRHKFKQTL
jgi:hypothetical protein